MLLNNAAVQHVSRLHANTRSSASGLAGSTGKQGPSHAVSQHTCCALGLHKASSEIRAFDLGEKTIWYAAACGTAWSKQPLLVHDSPFALPALHGMLHSQGGCLQHASCLLAMSCTCLAGTVVLQHLAMSLPDMRIKHHYCNSQSFVRKVFAAAAVCMHRHQVRLFGRPCIVVMDWECTRLSGCLQLRQPNTHTTAMQLLSVNVHDGMSLLWLLSKWPGICVFVHPGH